MPHTFRPHAAIALTTADALRPRTFLRAVAEVLKRLDAESGAAPRASARHCAVVGDTLIVKLDLAADAAGTPRVAFHLAGRPGHPLPPKTRAVSVLAEIVMRALPLAEADHVEWLSPGVKLAPEEFRASQSYISPRRARTDAAALPATDESLASIERNLARMMEEQRTLFETRPAAAAPAEATRPQASPFPDLARGEAAPARQHAPAGFLASAMQALRGADLRLSALRWR
ncbi:hypothetical protein [Roseivivax isoporae]|uniref:Uncharacterized protein n=1 Tax=Roseivivax isoporae LMG 25204 TaxID=1449351 RepID=X7FD09_9RHOB|nr:hypothetical protein [Roseivivax isoporae]ETX30797.1 hypothetical protein RISW2_07555 [Roseivivax isoporae LMG 25204]